MKVERQSQPHSDGRWNYGSQNVNREKGFSERRPRDRCGLFRVIEVVGPPVKNRELPFGQCCL